MKDLFIVGCGGFGREVLDVVEAVNHAGHTWNVLGFVDDNPSDVDVERVHERGYDVVGGLPFLTGRARGHFVVGIGTGHVRRAIDATLTSAGLSAATLIHPSSTLGEDNQIADGAVICSGARITTNVQLGRHVHLNLNTTVGHDARLGDFVTVNPLVAISGAVEIGHGSTLGTHSSLLQGLTLEPGTFVGAGACVTRSVMEPNTLVVGVPAKPIRKGERP